VDGWACYDQALEQDYSWQCLVENLLDPAHLQFTHEGTQGVYIAPTDKSVPEATEFTVTDRSTGPAGSFETKIITDKTAKKQNTTIIFEPPFTVKIQIVFENGWKFHQMHYCVPMGKYRTLLLVRSMRDWLKFMPDSIMWKGNPRVIRQDACVLMAQQLRLQQGSSRWNYPVKADALGVRFRAWWLRAEKSNPWFKSYSGSSFKKGGGIVRAHVDDIEDSGRCHDHSDMVGATNTSMSLRTVRQIIDEAPAIWPNEIAKETGDDVSTSLFSTYTLTRLFGGK
jgi:hypothetical protein